MRSLKFYLQYFRCSCKDIGKKLCDHVEWQFFMSRKSSNKKQSMYKETDVKNINGARIEKTGDAKVQK